MTGQRFGSVWDAIENTPEEAGNMKQRSEIMMALKQHIEKTQASQAQAAELLGVTQPQVSDLIRGKIDLFSLDALVNMATSAGIHKPRITTPRHGVQSLLSQEHVHL